MGRWEYSNRMTVEECKNLSTAFLKKYHYFSGIQSGIVSWIQFGNETDRININVNVLNHGGEYMQLQYMNINLLTGEKSELDYRVKEKQRGK